MKIFNLEIRGGLAIKVMLARREKQELLLGCNYIPEISWGRKGGTGLMQESSPH